MKSGGLKPLLLEHALESDPLLRPHKHLPEKTLSSRVSPSVDGRSGPLNGLDAPPGHLVIPCIERGPPIEELEHDHSHGPDVNTLVVGDARWVIAGLQHLDRVELQGADTREEFVTQ